MKLTRRGWRAMGRGIAPSPVLLLLLVAPLGATQEVTVFENVTVVPMNGERVLAAHSVVVRGARIEAIEPADAARIPAGARVIDGADRFLMPGLIDAHVHIKYEDELVRFVAYGVTAVRNMSGQPDHLAWRSEIARGERVGPTIHSAAAALDAQPIIWPGVTEVETVEQAEAAVSAAEQAGWDYVKVYDSLSPAVYDAIVGATRVPVVGHVPLRVGLERVLASGQHSIEHLFGYEAWLQPGGPVTLGTRVERSRAWSSVDPERYPEVVRRTVDAGIWNCPTLTMFFQLSTEPEIDEAVTRSEFREVSRAQIEEWKTTARQIGRGVPVVRSTNPTRMALVNALYEGGAHLVAGTDTGMPLVPAGRALHWELERFVDAGMSPFQALETATSAAAECLGNQEIGTVEKGARADLLLLERNPLKDVRNLSSRVGVMTRGVWHSGESLDERLAALADSASRSR